MSGQDQLPRKVLFGAAWYPEYTPEPRVEEDLDLMAAASVSVVRVGESVWSTWEPEDGRFDLDWLAPALDGAHERGISVVLGTPTYAVPMWLARKHPEIAAEAPDGHRLRWGSRQEVDFTHPAFRFHAERVVRAVVGRYATHPAVIGYQVDNEPGLHLLHNRAVVEAFVDDLRRTHGDVATLNEVWGLTYWSHRLSRWADLWSPHGNAQPQYDQAWRAFQCRLTTEFIAWQAGLVREVTAAAGRGDRFVTTCVSYSRAAVDEWDVDRALDVAAGNPYYAVQDGLALPAADPAPAQGWTTTGTWALIHSADRMHASKQAPFLVTETNAGPIGGSSANFPAWDGQWRQAAWALVARGARMVEYWHWHTLHAGTETYWGGVLPHDQRPGRVHEQVSQLGAEFARAGATVAGLHPDAHVGLLYSVPSKWGLAFQPPSVPGSSSPFARDEGAYDRLVGVWARGAFDAALSTRVLHDRQVLPPAGVEGVALDPAEVPVLLVPALYAAGDALLDRLVAYADAGGHLVLGVRTGYADELVRARREVKPGRLAEAAGASYQEFSNLAGPLPLRPTGGAGEGAGPPPSVPPLVLPPTATATTWVDCLRLEGATALAGYDHPHFGRFPAVTTAARGRGRVTVVGTVPDAATSAAIVDWALAAAPARSGSTGRSTAAERRWGGPETVRVSSATAPDGTRVHVVHNWSWEPCDVVVPTAVRDLLGPERSGAGEALRLGAWDVRVLAEG
ncbi:beta-galactosidase [Paenibacillus sp. TRM 82003]|uniref:beta-galactosidase n=1 Tax=Kineococcus sp. TRM81007 TaxID=2925831 RepID=UPI001F585930|nr:beta-galactosidase [Kineococcus sp. TRM81007]MCI2236937.1 beta-galactosidase [Kineococcus sp. TRM81007]MCI3921929.1 beta-galactosidase [Paenibacillus sp. TRM 82003]